MISPTSLDIAQHAIPAPAPPPRLTASPPSPPAPIASPPPPLVPPAPIASHLMTPTSTTLFGYKPALTVDVNVDMHDEGPSTSVTPKTTHTPHVSTNIFVAGIPSSWDDTALREHYNRFGEILSTKVVPSRHFGFVMFRKAEAAHAAINATHLTRPAFNSPTLLHVSIAMHDEGVDDEPNERIFVRGLPQWATKDHLRQCFGVFGTVIDCAVLMNPLGQCKGSGFVHFATVQDATAAINGRDKIKIEGWEQPLEVKYSETPEVRQLRHERNRNRQRTWLPTPKYKNGTTLPIPPLQSPFAVYSQPLPVMPSPQIFPMLGQMPFPVLQPSPATTLTSPQPTQIVYPPPPVLPTFMQGLSLYQPAPVILINAPPLPQKGDLHLSGGPLTEELVRTLVQPYGAIEAVKRVETPGSGGASAVGAGSTANSVSSVAASGGMNGGAYGGGVDYGSYVVRMKDATQHAFVAQQLNGTTFSTGQVLAVGLYV